MTSPEDRARTALSRRDFLKVFLPINIEALSENPAVPPIPVAPLHPVLPLVPVAPAHPAATRRFALDALKDLPEPALQQLVPVLRRDLSATIQDTAVIFRGEDGDEGHVPLCQNAGAAVRLFDGQRSLEQIGSTLEISGAAPAGSGFLLAREAFIALSARGVYHPVGPPVSSSGAEDGPLTSLIGKGDGSMFTPCE